MLYHRFDNQEGLTTEDTGAYKGSATVVFGPWDAAHSVVPDFMTKLKLKIDVSGTTNDEAWRNLRQYDEIKGAAFGPQFGSSGCKHAADSSHLKGEWIGAEIELQTPLLAQYAMSHYLEQERVLDADVE